MPGEAGQSRSVPCHDVAEVNLQARRQRVGGFALSGVVRQPPVLHHLRARGRARRDGGLRRLWARHLRGVEPPATAGLRTPRLPAGLAALSAVAVGVSGLGARRRQVLGDAIRPSRGLQKQVQPLAVPVVVHHLVLARLGLEPRDLDGAEARRLDASLRGSDLHRAADDGVAPAPAALLEPAPDGGHSLAVFVQVAKRLAPLARASAPAEPLKLRRGDHLLGRVFGRPVRHALLAALAPGGQAAHHLAALHAHRRCRKHAALGRVDVAFFLRLLGDVGNITRALRDLGVLGEAHRREVHRLGELLVPLQDHLPGAVQRADREHEPDGLPQLGVIPARAKTSHRVGALGARHANLDVRRADPLSVRRYRAAPLQRAERRGAHLEHGLLGGGAAVRRVGGGRAPEGHVSVRAAEIRSRRREQVHRNALRAPEQALGADRLLLPPLLVLALVLLLALHLLLLGLLDVSLQERTRALEHLRHDRLALRRVDVLLPQALQRAPEHGGLVAEVVVVAAAAAGDTALRGGDAGPLRRRGGGGELLLFPASLGHGVQRRRRRRVRVFLWGRFRQPQARVLDEERLLRQRRQVGLVPRQNRLEVHVEPFRNLVQLLPAFRVVRARATNRDFFPRLRVRGFKLVAPPPARGGGGGFLLLPRRRRPLRALPVLALGPLDAQQEVHEVGERGVRQGLDPAPGRVAGQLDLVVPLLDPRVGERHLGAYGPPLRLLRLVAALLQPLLLGPLHAVRVAADEARLRGVPLPERLEALALADDLGVRGQVVLAERARARLAPEQHPADGGGFAPALRAAVVRAPPARRLCDFALGHAYALGVHGDGAQVAAHDITAVPARLTGVAVPVVAPSHLRARFLGLVLFPRRLARVDARLALFQAVVVRLEHGVPVDLHRGLF